MKRLKIFALLLGLGFAVSATTTVEAQIWKPCDTAASDSALCADPEGEEATSIIKRLIDFFLYALGITSVILIIHSGFKYVTSRGDAEQVKSAKNTLLYAVVGIVVAMSAFIIVNFVVGAFGGASGDPDSGQETDSQGGGGGDNQ